MSHGTLPGTSDVIMCCLKLHSHFRNVHIKIQQAASNYNKVNWTLAPLKLLPLTRRALYERFAGSQVLMSQNRFFFFNGSIRVIIHNHTSNSIAFSMFTVTCNQNPHQPQRNLYPLVIPWSHPASLRQALGCSLSL